MVEDCQEETVLDLQAVCTQKHLLLYLCSCLPYHPTGNVYSPTGPAEHQRSHCNPWAQEAQGNCSEQKGGEGGANVRDNDSDVPWYSTNLAHENQASVLSTIYIQKILREKRWGEQERERRREGHGKRQRHEEKQKAAKQRPKEHIKGRVDNFRLAKDSFLQQIVTCVPSLSSITFIVCSCTWKALSC